MQQLSPRILIVALCLAAGAFAQTNQAPIEWSPHAAALATHRDAPTSPDLIGSAERALIPLQPRASRGELCRTVFGYLPYWCSSSNLRYDLLTHLACFSVEVNANGTLGNDHGWPWTSLINTAHSNGVKVILVATLFDDSDIYTLITNSSYKNAFFTNIKAKMLEGNADGLNIDFEGNGASWKPYINDFMADLTDYLHTEIPGSEVTFAGPSVNWSSAWDLPGLAASCDGIFIMGYAFWGSWSSTSGPNAPLTGGTYNITNTVLTQYGAVTQNTPEKLILGVPYYGHHWTTDSSAARAGVISFIGSTRFYNDEPDSQTYGPLWDATSQTPWYRYYDGTRWHQIWFDNAESLGLKYDLAEANNLQGVGMWALDYDGARTELWDALESHFAGCWHCCDYDGDGDVDFSDFQNFAFCLQGPDSTYNAGHNCLIGDADADEDLDLADFAEFQMGFGGG